MEADRNHIARWARAEERRFDGDVLADSLRALGDMVKVLGEAAPARKAKIYADLGLELTFDPENNEVLIAAKSNQDHIGYRSVSEGDLSRCPIT
ncbi:hypothetical protein ACIBIZ_18595 [Nonomuraea spiralis]|uniref:hypothetical protein n=1 Tax=Nonomuraea spiralis TaxID=46182 RepID=UPI0037998F28